MNYRILAKTIKKAIRTFPAIVVTGPRQSGKTTLLKYLLSDYRYVSMENPDIRMRAKEDPVGFLEENGPPIILDEIQYAPELLSYIKSKIDENRKAGQWILTGSQNFVLMQKVSQSLAGRAAILSLLPFNLVERIDNGQDALNIFQLLRRANKKSFSEKYKNIRSISLSEILLRGNYPEIAVNKKVDKNLWCGSYISTYLERDIRNLVNIGDLGQFEKFLRLCAIRTGQILNISDLARDVGVSITTAKRWLSLLETGYQICLLYPYYKNLGKRIIKSPKIYFNDTALVSFLLGIRDQKTLLGSSHFPHIFETLVVTDFLKRFLHFGEHPALYYLRTRDGLEIDLVLEENQKLHLMEIKSTATIYPKHATSLIKAKKDLSNSVLSANLISLSPKSYQIIKGIKNLSWKDLLFQ